MEIYITKIIKDSRGASHGGPRINEQITALNVRLINEEGEMLGVLSKEEAIKKASETGFDLVEISPHADPPVCKILDYGKYKYEEQKKRAAIRKNQKIIEVKEIQMRPNIDIHDFDVKMRSAKKFIDNGDKLKVTMRFRGREMAHQELGMEVLDRVKNELGETVKVEQSPKLEGRRMIMVLVPAK